MARVIQLEWKLDWRNRAAAASVFIYILAAVFLCLQSFKKVDDPLIWNNLFWLIIVFGSANAIIRSSGTSNRGRSIYMYFLCRPGNVIMGKMLYQSMVILVLAAATLLFFSVMLGTEAVTNINVGLYAIAIVLGSLGVAFIFTIISAMSAKAGNKNGLASILGIPLIIPLLVSLNELCTIALFTEKMHIPINMAYEPLFITAAVDVLAASLAYILFPYIWTE